MKAAIAASALLLPLPAIAAAPEIATEYLVREGETLNGIANRAGVSRDAIVAANGLEPPFVVRAGSTLKIPRTAKVEKADGATPSAAALARETRHRVREGETLGGIAMRAKVPRILIIEANRLQPPFDVKAGDTLIIPRNQRYVVRSGDTASGIANDTGVSWQAIALANGLDSKAPVKTGQSLIIPTLIELPDPGAPAKVSSTATGTPSAARFARPLAGNIRRSFTPRTQSDFHDGWDITAPRGAAVGAAEAGTVIFAGNGSGAEKQKLGLHVVIDHGDGWQSTYAFLSRATVRPGYRVTKGERVGLVGDTGLAKGNELHFEMRRNGKPVDPGPLIQD